MSIDVQAVLSEKISKSEAVLKENLKGVRAGRANPAILDKVLVDYYGTPSPVKNIANVSAPDPRTILVNPFDPSSLKDIEHAILAANIGINPTNDGKVIRLAVPELTEETRKDLVKQVKKMGEDAKVAVRNERRTAMDELKKQQKASEITEDDLKTEEKDVQKKIDDAIKEIDKIIAEKEKEIMAV